MTVDARTEQALKLMGEQLRAYRENRNIKVSELEEITGIDKTTIYGIERGAFNFTIDKFARLLAECSVSFYDFLTGLKTDKLKAEDRELHRRVQAILDSGLPDHVRLLRIAIDGIQQQVDETLNPRARAEEPAQAPKVRIPRTRLQKSNTARNEKKKESTSVG